MDAVTYPDEAVKAELAAWIFAKADVSRHKEAGQALGVAAIPVAVALAPDGRVLGRIEGFVEPAEFARRLRELRR
jgi:thioredoxin-like negative regulator of GroEL